MYKRLRFIIRYSRAFLSKHYLPLLFGTVLSVLLIFWIPRILLFIPQLRVTRHVGIIGRHTLSDLPLIIQSQISIGLTVIGPDGQPGPGLAQSWDVTGEGKIVTFNLNPDLSWQDGTPLIGSDIQYRFRGSQIEYPDDHKIVFKLQDPYSPLTTLVSRPIFKQSSDRNIHKPIGTGIYKIKSYRQNGVNLDTLTLTPAFADNKLPVLTYHFYSSPLQARIAFKLGVVQEIVDISEPSELLTWPNTKIVPIVQKDRYVAIFFNTTDQYLSGASGKNLRLALAYFTPKPEDSTRATGPISSSSWSYNPDVKKYEPDPVRGKELLNKVEIVPDKLTIRTLPAYIEVAETIKTEWEKLGIEVEIVSQTELPMDFQIALVAQAIPIDPDQYIYWHSTEATTNITHLNNPRVDKLLEDGRKNWDLKLRKEIYMDFQKFLIEEIPAIFLYHPTSYNIHRG